LNTGHGGDHSEIVHFADLSVVPWRNGGGVTREVAVGGSGGQDFNWRISIADVNVPGPFSTFPGVDRIITLVDGVRMDLLIDGVEHVLGLYEPFTCTITDLSEVRPLAVAGGEVLVLLSGSAVVTGAEGGRTDLRPLDAVCPSGPAVRALMGSGRAAVVRITSSQKGASRSKAGADLQQGQ